MTTILGISGSLRKGSYNTALLNAAVPLMPEGSILEVGAIRGIPLYDGDVEAAGYPQAAAALKARFIAADGVLLVTPEYNNSIPGVFKNVIDWLSRPPSDVPRIFRDRPVAIIGATPGRGGTILAQAAWLPVLRTLRTRPWFGGRVTISEAKKAFDESGQLVDEEIRSQVRVFLAGFVEFIHK